MYNTFAYNTTRYNALFAAAAAAKPTLTLPTFIDQLPNEVVFLASTQDDTIQLEIDDNQVFL